MTIFDMPSNAFAGNLVMPFLANHRSVAVWHEPSLTSGAPLKSPLKVQPPDLSDQGRSAAEGGPAKRDKLNSRAEDKADRLIPPRCFPFMYTFGKPKRRNKKEGKRKIPNINDLFARRVDPSALAFSLASHRHSSIRLLFSSRFINS